MKILLVNANRFKQPWPVIPFGLCCVASSVEAAGHAVRVLDLCFEPRPEQALAGAVHEFRPDVVGVSIRNIDNSAGYRTLFLLDETRTRVIAPLKAAFPGPVVIGGPAVGINAAEMLDYLDVPYAIRGDGERAFVGLLRRLEGGAPLDGLPGLVRREQGRVVEDNEPDRVPDLDALPPARPYRHLDLRPYRRFDSPLQIQTKRGCPLTCTYCTYSRIEGRTYRLRDPERVVDEIEDLVRETGIDHVEFTDSTFNVPLEHAKNVLRALLGRGLRLRLRTMGLNPAAVDEELVDLMKRTGFRDVDLGAESGNDVTLEGLGKNFRKADVLRAGALLRAKGIPTTWYLLLGAPGETEETLRETFDTVNRAAGPWNLVNIGVGLRVYNGAPVAEALRSRGQAPADGFLRPVAYEPEGISLDRVKALARLEALRRPNYFLYDEDETTPPALVVAGATLLRWFAPWQPLWRLHILLRRAQRAVGLSAWQRRRLLRSPAGRPTAGAS